MSLSKMCRFGANCRFGTKCANEHTEDHKKIFAAKQAEKFKNMRACHNGSRCTKPGCTHGHNAVVIRDANMRLGFIHEIEIRVAEFYKIEADLAEIDEMIAKDREPVIEAEHHVLAHFDNMIVKAKQAEQIEEDIQNQFDAFVVENDEHLERANALPKGDTEWADLMKVAPGAPKKACSVAKYLAEHKGRELFPADE